MKRVLLVVAVTVLSFVAGGGGWVWWRVTSFTHEPVTDDLFMIQGFGGNVAALRTGEGTVLVDTMTFAWQGQRIRGLAEELTPEPVVLVINTHYHGDHAHGTRA
jgi:glyoxylase-like metal-dependent hydrolase (beta-lactamase superfamily II)